MSRIAMKILLLLCFSGFSLPGFSQDTASKVLPPVWDLAACLQYAKENNIQIRSLQLDKQSAEQDQLLAKSALLPDLYGSASQNFNHYNQATATNGNALNYSGSVGLNSSWTLYRGGYLKTDIKQKDLSVQAANFNILQQENDITLQITQAYLNILVDKESIIYNQDLVKTSEAQLDQAQRQFKAGSVARKVVAQFEAQLAGDRYNLNAAENAERKDKITLKQLLQLPDSKRFDIVKPDTILSVENITDLNTVQQYALQNRPEVKNAELGVQISDLGLSKARAGYLPSLTLGAGIGSSYARDPNYNVFRQFDNNFNQQVGFTLSVPIFTNRQNKTNVAKAKIDIAQAKLTLENTKTTLALNTESAYINAQNSQSQYLSAAEQLKYNQEVFRIANQELKIGAANIVEFYQQRNLYVQAMQSYIQAKYNAALAAKIYEFYLGTPIKL
ncbi:TolC family protein [Pedobacter heparinus]|uniref:Outer membrane efflux protein n=1 Tax=Pedobacter heparinus (strain ATCC 13125 / DSM 2366 / CIP 104194 / JCM 7457 / NBRC 12017 / NCIMB 9290 / NRRL B-14731 / HIM 762-3) TaxID=485917 RepID=C6Y397_PEDHD|nr:TolC family protein [Pedobacter heparinus]ACU05322.1 outer membrane efflux protein [Pedobacter heparinus DSM 2366]